MALTDEQIAAQNRWWTEQDWGPSDPHLRRLTQQPIRLPATLVDELDLAAAGVHTLRGPRQVGKSTDLKLLVERALLREGREPRSVVYLSLDLLIDQPVGALANSVRRAKEIANRPGPQVVLLDEVTVVPQWQMAVKALWDGGVIDRDVIVCTGSSAIDLARGTAERLPGRRGAGTDHLVLPQSFANFARAVFPSIPESLRISVEGLTTRAGREAIQEARAFGPQLSEALGKYLVFGGLPASVAEAATGAGAPSEANKKALWDSLLREVQREGASEPALHALLERVVRSLGSKTNWSKMAQEMDVPLRGKRGASRGADTDRRTLRHYVEFLAAGYFALIVYFLRSDSGGNAVSKDKKVYLGDPLLHTITLDRIPGSKMDIPAAVENVMAMALFRRYEEGPGQAEAFVAPSRLHVWESARGGEVDFVCGSRPALDAVEVKYERQVSGRVAFTLARSFPGRPGVLATKETLDLVSEIIQVPASLFLWALG